MLAELWLIRDLGTRGAAPLAVYPVTETPYPREPNYLKCHAGPHWVPPQDKPHVYIWVLTIDRFPVAERVQRWGTLDLKTPPRKRGPDGSAGAGDYALFIRWEFNCTRSEWAERVAEWRAKAASALGRSLPAEA